ncbi:MAG: ABC transporter permease [Armatimonadota bacterium]|nr:ABC transporter permease [Armatimonadota bacterium]
MSSPRAPRDVTVQRYLTRRLLLMVPVLIGVTVLTFLMRVLVPGDPIEVMTFGQFATPEVKAELRRQYGLDKPVATQYAIFMARLARGDLGTSIRTRQPVAWELAVLYPRTLRLAAAAMLVAVTLGLVLGVLAAVRRDTWVDLLAMVAATIGVSMPSFWLGLVLMRTFGVRLALLPVMGSETWAHLVLPASTLGLIFSAILARLTRSNMLEVLGADYIRTARAKGLRERVVVWRHALKNAAIPVLTVAGLQFGFLLGGAFIVETVFSYHGVGELAIKSILFRDFPMIQGITLLVALTTVGVNLLVDLLYVVLNPQVRYE